MNGRIVSLIEYGTSRGLVCSLHGDRFIYSLTFTHHADTLKPQLACVCSDGGKCVSHGDLERESVTVVIGTDNGRLSSSTHWRTYSHDSTKSRNECERQLRLMAIAAENYR